MFAHILWPRKIIFTLLVTIRVVLSMRIVCLLESSLPSTIFYMPKIFSPLLPLYSLLSSMLPDTVWKISISDFASTPDWAIRVMLVTSVPNHCKSTSYLTTNHNICIKILYGTAESSQYRHLKRIRLPKIRIHTTWSHHMTSSNFKWLKSVI